MRDMGPGNMQPIRIDIHTLLHYWLVSPFTCAVLAGLILVGLWYVQAIGDAGDQGQPWPIHRTAAFFAGLVAIEVAVQSSVAMLLYISFPMRVVQSLLLVMVAAPLLVLGAPVGLALETSSPRSQPVLLRLLESTPMRALAHPAVSFVLLFGGLLAYFLTPALASSLRHVWLLNLINLGFLVVAFVFWRAVLGTDVGAEAGLRPGRNLLFLAGAMGLESLLGIALVVRSTPAAPIYTLTGTHQGGAIWWVVAVMGTLVALFAVYAEWNRGDDLLEAAESADRAGGSDEPWPASARLSPPG
jgi:putative copper resistance protein D